MSRTGRNALEVRAEIAILYADVSGFTEMTERLGDALSFAVMRRYLAVLRAAAAEHAGREVEIRGDACLLAFESADEALACAAGVQRALAEARRADPSRTVGVRIGLHVGRPIPHEGGLFGRDVILAARLADLCRTHAILGSRAFRRRLRDASRVGRERRVRVKGFRTPEPVSRIFWAPREGHRRILPGPLENAAAWCREQLGLLTSRVRAELSARTQPPDPEATEWRPRALG
jgi:class 3 adenylate cyclase